MNLKQIMICVIAVFSSLMELNAATIPYDKKQSLNTGWSFLRQDVGSVWEVFRPIQMGKPESVPLWSKVTLPHCFNEYDAVDPYENYYQGVGWYKSEIKVKRLDKNEIAIIEVEGSGQKTDLYIVSNCQSGYIESFIKAHKMEEYFDDIQCWGDNMVPKGENNKLIMQRNGITRAVYVGDTSGDEQSARVAGIPFVLNILPLKRQI